MNQPEGERSRNPCTYGDVVLQEALPSPGTGSSPSRITRHQVRASIASRTWGRVLPTFFGLTGMLYLLGAILFGFIYLGYGFAVALFRSNTHAHRLLKVSVLYLPALLLLMMLDKV